MCVCLREGEGGGEEGVTCQGVHSMAYGQNGYDGQND